MDFFDLTMTSRSTEKVQKFGKRVVEHYLSLEPDPSIVYTSIPDTSIKRKDDLFLRPLNEYNEMPDQDDITGLQSYFNTHFDRPKLPILKYKDEIIDTIKQNMVNIVTAPTGSGKSTQVPQYILDDEYFNEKRHCKIVVTQPRRVAAISLANRVLNERNLPPLQNDQSQGTLVGYQIGMDKKINEDTRLIYMTTGVLLRKLINADALKEFTHIILDEVHERDKDTDFILLMIKRMLCMYKSTHRVRIIVMSATVNASKFAKYYQKMDPESGIPCPAPIIEIKEQMFNVSIFYLDQIRSSINFGFSDNASQINFQEPQISEKIYCLARELIKHFDHIDKQDSDMGQSSQICDRGSVLVFLPGIFEIETMQRILKNDKCSKTFDIICLHSTIPRQYQMKVFDKPTMGRRKIILSTNIAESSITVPDIKYVVDFCLSKELHADSGTGMSSLKYVWAPKSSLDQRKGRAGRVSKGRCYRLIENKFLKDLSDFATPEMQRCSVEQLILWCKMLDIGDPLEVLSYALDPPNLNKLREGALLLLEVGALVLPIEPLSNPLDQDLTFLGHVMGSMPLDVRLSRLIMFGLVFDCLSEAIIMAACLSLPAFLEIPYNNKQQKLDSYVSRMKKAKGTFSDPIMMLNVYNEWYNLYAAQDSPNTIKEAREYCVNNFVNFNRINEVASLVQDICSCLHRMNIPDSLSREREHCYTGYFRKNDICFRLKLALAGANYPYYFVQNKYALDKDNCMRSFGAKSPSDTIMYTGMRLEVSSNSELERKYKHDVSTFFTAHFDPIKRLTLEGNRLYVTFDILADANVSKSVYYSIKTKQLGMPLQLTSKQDVNLPTSDTISFKINEDSQELLHVSVTYIETPTKFFVHIRREDIRGDFDVVNEELQMVTPKRMDPHKIQENSFGMAMFEKTDCTLYRVKILKMDENFNVKVFYLDFGNSIWINANVFFEIPDDLLTRCPFQAVECSIEGICPVIDARSLSSSIKWDRHLVEQLRPILENKHFDAKVYYLLNNVLHVDLFESNNSFRNWLLSLNNKVSPAREDYRMEYARLMLGGYEVQLQKVTIKDKAEFKRESQKSKTCTLSGPTSPYEVEYCGLTDTARSFHSVIDSNSVCSVTICPNPSDRFTEMLTASSVALTSSGCRVQLRGVTQHFPVRGLPDMLVLMFAPKIQLHTTPSRLNYIGCRAGLGTNSRGEAMWPDHDLQVTFDQRVELSDIHIINKIRLAISSILQADDDNASKFKYTIDTIKQHQLKILHLMEHLMYAIDNRNPAISHHEDLKYSWEPSNCTLNYLDVSGEFQGDDCDVLRPHSSLYFIENDIEMHIEHKTAKKRIKYLQKHVYQLNETTGVNNGQFLKCELCNAEFEKYRDILSHIDSDAHNTECRRLDHWTCPKH